VHNAAEAAITAHGPAVGPRLSARGQLNRYRTGPAGGQRLGCLSEQNDLVTWVEDLPGVVVHHHHVTVARQHDSAAMPAGPQVLLQRLDLRRAASGRQRLRDLVGGGLGERDQQRVGVLAPAGQVHRAGHLARDRAVDRRRGAGKVLKVFRIVLMAEHVGRAAALHRSADAVGSDVLLSVLKPGAGWIPSRCRSRS